MVPIPTDIIDGWQLKTRLGEWANVAVAPN
jgi:hypothetical protein